MLFDLQGKRRRLVQGTYLMLAVLLGGGLVFFGIGGDVSGGLFDAFSDQRSGGGGNSLIKERIDDAEKRLEKNPRDGEALKEIARAQYQVASQDANEVTGQFSEEGKKDLELAAAAWERYLALEPKEPDDSLAALMIQAYSEVGLNNPEKAAQAAEFVVETRPSAQAYLQLATYAGRAGQTRKADLAGKKAVELAPRGQKKAVEQAVEAAKAPPPTPTTQGGGG